MTEAKVVAVSPLAVVSESYAGDTHVPIDGYPARPDGNPPALGDQCAIDATDKGRVFIVSWKAANG